MKIINFIMIMIFSLVLSYFLPIFINLFFHESVVIERIKYSPLIDDFMLSRFDKDKGTKSYQIIGGKDISEDEYILNQPFTNYLLLIQKGIFPAKFQAYADPKFIRQNSQNFSLRYSANISKNIPLYPLLNTNKYGRLDFMPVLFRLGDKIEAIDIKTGKINQNLSDELNSKLGSLGFSFPPRQYFSNPSTLKALDEGAFIVDSKGEIFHLKSQNGKFILAPTKLIKQNILNIAISEDNRREFYALMVLDDEMGLISYDDYKFIPLNATGYDPRKANLNLKITPINKILTFLSKENSILRVMDLNYTERKSYQTALVQPISNKYLKSYFLPFELRLIKDSYFYQLKIANLSQNAFGLWIVVALLIFIYKVKFKKSLNFTQILSIALFGIYGFIASVFYNTKK